MPVMLCIKSNILQRHLNIMKNLQQSARACGVSANASITTRNKEMCQFYYWVTAVVTSSTGRWQHKISVYITAGWETRRIILHVTSWKHQWFNLRQQRKWNTQKQQVWFLKSKERKRCVWEEWRCFLHHLLIINIYRKEERFNIFKQIKTSLNINEQFDALFFNQNFSFGVLTVKA